MIDPQNPESGPVAGPRERRCAVVAAGIDPGPLLDALRRLPDTRVGDICIFPSNGQGAPDADYLILAADDSSRFPGLEEHIERWSGRHTRVMLALPESKCAMLGELPRRADGLILLGEGLKYLEQSLRLAEEGYSIMPTARPGAGNGAGYLEALGRLGAGERAILRLLAAGESNRSIAESLDEGEARVKSSVRAILIKLGCRNRTEAAVLAATVLLPLLDDLAADEASGDRDLDS
ncbi:MAG: LuxR C-terminal-related transcriptional regulator [Kiloniellaceae bacterium]